MYVWFWRRLPGSLPVRVALALLALAVVVVVLLIVVFPRVAPLLPLGDVTIGPAPDR